MLSPDLKRFYKELDEWIDATHGVAKTVGRKSRETVFDKEHAICSSLVRWLEKEKVIGRLKNEDTTEIIYENIRLFQRSGLSRLRPFNKSLDELLDESNKETIYENEARRKWIKDHANV